MKFKNNATGLICFAIISLLTPIHAQPDSNSDVQAEVLVVGTVLADSTDADSTDNEGRKPPELASVTVIATARPDSAGIPDIDQERVLSDVTVIGTITSEVADDIDGGEGIESVDVFVVASIRSRVTNVTMASWGAVKMTARQKAPK